MSEKPESQTTSKRVVLPVNTKQFLKNRSKNAVNVYNGERLVTTLHKYQAANFILVDGRWELDLE